MKKVAVRLAGATVLALASMSSHALFVVSDSRFGERTLIEDSQTGLSWLRLDVTRGQSYNAVYEQLGSTYRGFGIASGSDMWTLMGNIGIKHEVANWGLPSPTLEHMSDVNATLQQLGGTASGGGWSLRGFSDWGAAAYPDLVAGITGNIFLQGFGAYSSATAAAFYDDAVHFNKLTSYEDRGVFLVAAPVPEPETYALMAAGLLAVLAARRQKPRPTL